MINASSLAICGLKNALMNIFSCKILEPIMESFKIISLENLANKAQNLPSLVALGLIPLHYQRAMLSVYSIPCGFG